VDRPAGPAGHAFYSRVGTQAYEFHKQQAGFGGARAQSHAGSWPERGEPAWQRASGWDGVRTAVWFARCMRVDGQTGMGMGVEQAERVGSGCFGACDRRACGVRSSHQSFAPRPQRRGVRDSGAPHAPHHTRHSQQASRPAGPAALIHAPVTARVATVGRGPWPAGAGQQRACANRRRQSPRHSFTSRSCPRARRGQR
jgi:hypothetical protein